MDSKIIAKRRRKLSPLMSFNMVHRLLLWRRKASGMKKEKKRLALEVAKLRAETNRFSELHREDKRHQEEIVFKIAKQRKENKWVLDYDSRRRRGVGLMLDILDARDRRDFVTANNLTHSFRELMMAQQNEEKQAFTGYEHP